MHVLIVEDDQKLAALMMKELPKAGIETELVNNGLDAFSRIRHGHFDACIVDLMLPEMDGLTLIEKLRMRHDQTPILVLSARGRLEDRIQGLESGGDDYLSKPFAFAELIARLRALVRRSAGASAVSVLKVGDLSVNLINREVIRDGQKISLQQKELDLLIFLMANAERVVSRDMIMKNVWDFQFDPHTNIIESRMSRLRDKIDKPFSEKLIHTIRGAGYVIKHRI